MYFPRLLNHREPQPPGHPDTFSSDDLKILQRIYIQKAAKDKTRFIMLGFYNIKP